MTPNKEGNLPPHYVCTGRTEHHEDCDGNCGELDELDILISYEMNEWAKSGLETGSVGINGFMMDCQLQAVIKALAEYGVLTNDQLNDTYKPLLLEHLITMRQKLEPAVRRARIAQGMQEGLLGPNGQPL